jgi:hypothetical protein
MKNQAIIFDDTIFTKFKLFILAFMKIQVFWDATILV